MFKNIVWNYNKRLGFCIFWFTYSTALRGIMLSLFQHLCRNKNSQWYLLVPLIPRLFIAFNFSFKTIFFLNWLSLLVGVFSLNSLFFNPRVSVIPSRMIKIISSLNMAIFKEFKTLTSFKAVPLRGVTFSWVFIRIMLFNLMGLTPYIFTPTRSISLTMFIAASFMYFLDWSSFMNKSWQIRLLPPFTRNFLILGVVIIELISRIIRPLTLSIRLAANIVAGHLLIGLVNGARVQLFPVMFSFGLILMFLEISVAIIQRYVFTSLRMMFFAPTNYLKLVSIKS